jgi:iron-sulfur cluster assembly accessory protein
MISLTPVALEKVKGLLAQERESLPEGGLRIYVQGGGCSGLRYGLVLDEAAEGDRIFEQDGLKVIVDPSSLDHLAGAEVDFKEDLMGGGFSVNNPNAAAASCGCNHGSADRCCC